MSAPSNERLTAGRVLSHLGVMVAVAAVMGVVVAGLAIPFAGVLGIGARDVAKGMDNLPTELKTEPLAQKTRILDSKGNLIATLYDENRVNVPLQQISRTMVKSIIAIEDSRYYEHGALDLRGTLRALVTNQASDGVVQGGSSITQQMVKLTLLSQAKTRAEKRAATDDTYERKIRELRYAIAFEENYSKDWILERYLNIAYFGDGAFGVQSAARHYFDTNAKNLNLRQSAMLAGLVKNPTGYDPTNSPDEAIKRRNVVLDRMAELNVITREKAAKTKDDEPRARRDQDQQRLRLLARPVLLRLRHQRADEGPFARQDHRGAPAAAPVRWSHHPHHPRPADAGGGRPLRPRRTSTRRTGPSAVWPWSSPAPATSAPSPSPGRWAGRRSSGETYLNYVVPQRYGDSAGFQAGSTFKAFVLATALREHVPPTFQLSVPAQVFIDMNKYQTCAPGGGEEPYASSEIWDPTNFDNAPGTFNLYTGTQHSVNTFFAQLELVTGICKPLPARQGDGHRPDRPRRPSGSRRSPSASSTPARWRWPRPTPRSRPGASTAPAGR